MKARQAIGLASTAVTIAIIAAVSASGPNSTARAAESRPNILVLETDDQTLAEMEVLPNVRRLIGDEGVTFDNNFDSFSLCCPSRASLLTGQYSHNNGVRGNALPQGGYYKLDSTNTLAVWLKNSGYYTVHLGKYLNGYGTRDPREIPPGWSEWHGAVDPTTYRYYNYTLNENGALHTYCANRQPSCYQTDVYRDKADAIIRERAGKGPFFFWVAFLANHSGAPREAGDPPNLGTPVPAPRYENRFAGVPLPRPPSFNEADVSDKPAAIRNRPLLTPRRIAAIQENWQQRRETLLAVDDAVVSIVDTLRSTGQLDKTLILFTSDNGFFHGEHRVANGKVLLYEPSIRVPLLMRWTGNSSLPRGVHRSQLTMNVDYTETMLAAAGVKPGRIEDGVSLLPLWRDGGKELGRDLLIDNTPGNGHFDSIRSRHFLYAEYANGDRELYDLAKDPDELQSQHANPAYDGVKAALAARLHVLVSCAGARCHVPPAVRMRTARHGCAVTAIVTGANIRTVGFSANHRGLRSDTRAPFRATVRVRGSALLRARVAVGVDRLVSVDRTVRGC
ncbi:MAG: sulfatase [Actinobacteria bacterium]|nr:MAG: sulfatase [Actinomycetota bacterium]